MGTRDRNQGGLSADRDDQATGEEERSASQARDHLSSVDAFVHVRLSN